MKKSDDNLIDRTLEVWQPRNAQRLSDEDARAIVENVKGFFTLLLEWETNEHRKRAAARMNRTTRSRHDNQILGSTVCD